MNQPVLIRPLEHRGAVIMAVMAVASWSFSTTLEKTLVARFPPLTLIWFQLLVSAVVLWLALLARRQRLPSGRELMRLAWPGLLQPGLANTLFLLGLALTPASVFSLVVSSETVMTLLLARVFLNERIGPVVMLLAGVATVGVMIVSIGGPDDGRTGTWLGLAFLLVGTLIASLYGVVSRQFASVQASDPLLLATLHLTAGTILVSLVLPITSSLGHTEKRSSVPLEFWAWAALASLFQYALPFWLFLTALRVLSASLAALLLTLEPVFGVIAALVFLSERLAVLQWVGAALVLLALAGIAHAQTPAIES